MIPSLLIAQIAMDQLGPIVPWLAGCSLCLFLANQAINFWKQHLREQPSPANTYATREALEQVKAEAHGRIKRERAEIDAAIAANEARLREALGRVDEELDRVRDQLTSNNEAGEARAEKLHERINVILEAVSELRGSIQHRR